MANVILIIEVANIAQFVVKFEEKMYVTFYVTFAHFYFVIFFILRNITKMPPIL